jgi:ABC-type transport system involved in cytochrome bd biosynthesis fused ATPase/permease subunit
LPAAEAVEHQATLAALEIEAAAAEAEVLAEVEEAKVLQLDTYQFGQTINTQEHSVPRGVLAKVVQQVHLHYFGFLTQVIVSILRPAMVVAVVAFCQVPAAQAVPP